MTDTQVKPPKRTRTKKADRASVSSFVSPLISLLYPLARHVVLPAYFGNIDVSGSEWVPREGATILAPTHRSRWDPVLLSYSTGRPVSGRDVRFMTSINEMRGFQGCLVRRLGAFPIDPSRPGIGSLRHGLELLLAGEMLAIFPEGGIFHENKIKPFKPGMGRLAMQAASQAPDLNLKIIPVAIRYDRLPQRWGCDVNIGIGKPIFANDYDLDSVKKSAKQLTADLHEALQDLYDRSAHN